VGDGKSTSFWHDHWCGVVSLANKFPSLYETSDEQDCSMEYMKKKNWRPSFRRWLHEDLQNQLKRLYDIVYCFSINNNKDRAKWD
jgi:hypothetical protein